MPSEDWGVPSAEDAEADATTDSEESVTAPDPTRDLPSPSVEVPDPNAVEPDPEEATDADSPGVEVPEGLWLSFWYLVVVFNAALLAFGAGLLLATLGNDLELGGRLLFVGTVLALYGYYKYRTNPHRGGVDADAGQ